MQKQVELQQHHLGFESLPHALPTTQRGDTMHRGSVWEHLKSGGVYVILGQCRIEETNTAAIRYISVDGGTEWVRPEDQFLEKFVCVSQFGCDGVADRVLSIAVMRAAANYGDISLAKRREHAKIMGWEIPYE